MSASGNGDSTDVGRKVKIKNIYEGKTAWPALRRFLHIIIEVIFQVRAGPLGLVCK